ncbi:MAG: hypothetical protein H7Y04_14585 [Verrucomicrobia bacterium]|nr:hypothetical protein [Cytophagales bacterium]
MIYQTRKATEKVFGEMKIAIPYYYRSQNVEIVSYEWVWQTLMEKLKTFKYA